MNAAEALRDLQSKIPLSKAMGLEIAELVPERALLKGPLAPNRNHIDTVFGGSLYSAGALACYVLFRAISAESGIESDNLVIQNGGIEYLAPVQGDFEILCRRPEESKVRAFLEGLRRRKKGRLRLESEILFEGRVCARFTGDYVFQMP